MVNCTVPAMKMRRSWAVGSSSSVNRSRPERAHMMTAAVASEIPMPSRPGVRACLMKMTTRPQIRAAPAAIR